MAWTNHGTHAQEGDLAQLVGLRHKSFILRLEQGKSFHSHRGILKHDDLIGLPWGSQVVSHNGSPFFLLQPALGDVLRGTKRTTQILYPKDIGFILVTMGIGPGQHILEAGTGSGSLTTALAFTVGPQGKVTSYEFREQFQALAIRNLTQLGLAERVAFKSGDIADGFDETGVDALFLDVANPYDYIPQVKAALKPGGFFGSIQPTMNQVSLLLSTLRQQGFAFVEVCEVLLRYYKPEPARLRPVDRMVAHTGYLIFARSILPSTGDLGAELLAEAGVAVELEPEEE